MTGTTGESAQTKLAELESRCAVLEADLQATKRTLGDVLSDRDAKAGLLRQRILVSARLQRDLLESYRQKAACERERDEARAQLQQVLQSTSWRLTAPARVGVISLKRWAGAAVRLAGRLQEPVGGQPDTVRVTTGRRIVG
jgi:hypothetical protein